MPHDHWEVARVERRPALTFQGLYRLSRHVIRAFVAAGPKVETEVYNYRSEEAGVVIMDLAPQYWVWRPLENAAEALRRLEGQIQLSTSVLAKEPDATLVDIRPMLADVERLLPQASHAHRPALLNLHLLFNLMVSPDQRTPEFERFLEKHGEEANRPGPISLVVSTLLGGTNDWTPGDHHQALDAYFAQSLRSRALHAPRLLEAAACLEVAEKYRRAGEDAELRVMLARAVEAHPGHAGLLALESEFDPLRPIDWRAMLLPAEPNEPENASPPSVEPEPQAPPSCTG